MLGRLPIIGTSLKFNQLLGGIRNMHCKSAIQEFSDTLSRFIGPKYIYLTNSGISSFFIILKTLREFSKKKEVILPAYTAGSLVVAVIKAGLVPILCDISFDDFNLEKSSLFKAISQNTLAVVCVHMFGIAIKDIERFREDIPQDIFLIEDCAQGMGSKIRDKQIGNFSDVSFFSFNRGKNLSLYSGGCISTNNKEIAEAIEKNIDNLKEESLYSRFLIPAKILFFSLAVNPYIYRLGYSFISCFKDNAPPRDFTIKKNSHFQACLGLRLINKSAELFYQRYKNGMFLLHALRDNKEVILPKISDNIYPVFNRLPILFKDLQKKVLVKTRLWRDGIEASRMYLKPLHHMFSLGYEARDFPNANFFAQHLLVLPVHPSVKQADLVKMVRIIKEK